MTIPAAAKHKPLDRTVTTFPAIDRATGLYTREEIQRQERARAYVTGMGRIIPCSATGTNVITLTPNGHGDEDGESPLLEGFRFGDVFPFWAENTSTNSVTMTVVPKSGSLSTLKAYITNGSAQAGAGDVVQNLFYEAWYVPILDSSAGGFVLK